LTKLSIIISPIGIINKKNQIL
ncbi:MarR family transcriptional regulator, partial [Clostridioides difficile]